MKHILSNISTLNYCISSNKRYLDKAFKCESQHTKEQRSLQNSQKLSEDEDTHTHSTHKNQLLQPSAYVLGLINNSSFTNNVVSETERGYLITFNWWNEGNSVDYDYITVANTIFSENIQRFIYNMNKSSILNIVCLLGEWYWEPYLTVILLNDAFSNNLGTGLSLNGILAHLSSLNFTNNTGVFACSRDEHTISIQN